MGPSGRSCRTADILTKYKSLKDSEELLRGVNLQAVARESGRGERRGSGVCGNGDANGGAVVARMSWADAWEEEFGQQ